MLSLLRWCSDIPHSLWTSCGRHSCLILYIPLVWLQGNLVFAPTLLLWCAYLLRVHLQFCIDQAASPEVFYQVSCSPTALSSFLGLPLHFGDTIMNCLYFGRQDVKFSYHHVIMLSILKTPKFHTKNIYILDILSVFDSRMLSW